MVQPIEIPARGLVFDALAAGPPTGEVVVLLHGFPQTSACWTRLLETLAAAGYRAVAPDQRGYSPRARPTTVAAYRLPELVADVVAIADRLGAARIHLVGHDWGGVVAWSLAGLHPDRVATLTSVSTPHPRAVARALVAGTQALRSASIPVFLHATGPPAAGRRPWRVTFREGWDLVVCLTDLPRRSGLRPVVAAASVADAVALASLRPGSPPALPGRARDGHRPGRGAGRGAARPSSCRARGRLATVPEGTSQVPGSRSIRRRTAGPLAKERP